METTRLSARSILDGKTRICMTTRFEEQRPSSPRLRMRESKECSGWAGRVDWRVKPGVRVVDSPDLPNWVRPGSLATIDAMDQLRNEPELEWSYLSPSAELKPGQRTGKFRLGNDQLLVDATGKSQISVQDYAVAMIDELERPAHLRRRFTVGY